MLDPMGVLTHAAGGFGLVMAGRWLIRAQIIASFLRIGGILLIAIGVLAMAGIVSVDVSALLDLVDLVRGVSSW